MTFMTTIPGVNGHNWYCPASTPLATLADMFARRGLRLYWHRQQRRLVVIPFA